jgi:CheY-like chemotaxis protein
MSRAAASLAGCRILVVEDEFLIAMEMKRWLQAAGAEVLGPVPSVDRALDLIKDQRPDTAVLDVNLGYDDDVYPVADKLNVLGVPYLFATGDVRVSEAFEYAAKLRLEKPFVEAELVRALVKLTTSGEPVR